MYKYSYASFKNLGYTHRPDPSATDSHLLLRGTYPKQQHQHPYLFADRTAIAHKDLINNHFCPIQNFRAQINFQGSKFKLCYRPVRLNVKDITWFLETKAPSTTPRTASPNWRTPPAMVFHSASRSQTNRQTPRALSNFRRQHPVFECVHRTR